MKNICNTVRLCAVLIMLCSMSAGAFAQIATINGGLSTTFATYTANPGSTPFTLSDNGYINDSYIYGPTIELNISNTLPTCTVTVVAYRAASSTTFNTAQSATTYISGSVPGTSGICMLPWSTPSTANPTGINYGARGAVFFKAASGYTPVPALATGLTGGANGVYGINLGIGNSDGNSRVLDTLQDGYYSVVVSFNNSGTITTQTFNFVLQYTSANSTMSSATLTTTGTSCTSRTSSSTLTLYEPHLGNPSSISAQLYKNGVATGSAIPYADGGGYAAPGNIYPSFTPPAITANGTYVERFSQNFGALQFTVGTTNSYPFGSTVYALPVLSTPLYEADMTGTTPIAYTFAAGSPTTIYAPNSATPASSIYQICQKFITSAGPPVVYGQSPLSLTIVGTNNTSVISSTATITRYSDNTFTTAYSPAFSQTLFSGVGGWDGTYDLTTLFSGYMSNTMNTGYYKISVTSSANSCGTSALSANYYFFWAGAPVGALSLADFTNSPYTYSSTSGTICSAVSTCSTTIQVGNPSTAGYSGTLSGLKFKLEQMAGTCSSPTWTTIFDGTTLEPGSTSVYYPEYTNTTTSSWNGLQVSIVSYVAYMQSHVTGCNFRTSYISNYELASSPTEFRLTSYAYNDACSNTPTPQVFYLLNTNGGCKTSSYDETGIKDVDDETSVRLYPNPTAGKVKISLPEKLENASITLYDLQGRELQIPVLKSSSFECIADLSTMAKGVYILGINGQKVSKRVIVE